MQYINDDMDEFFRRAAEDYPLNTRGADWEKIQTLLSPNEGPDTNPNKKRYFLWLLLLLPVVLICNRVTDSSQPSLSVQKIAAVSATTTSKAAWKTNESKTDKPLNRGVKQMPAIVLDGSSAAILKTADAKKVKRRQNAHVVGNQTAIIVFNKNRTTDFATFSRMFGQNAEAQSGFSAEQGSLSTEVIRRFEEYKPQWKHTTVANSDLINKASVFAELSTRNNATEDSVKQNASATKQRRFYVGVMGGPDLSTVHFEKFSEVGFQAGVVLGYQLSNRLSVEAGVLSSKKYYYSEGEYLNTSKLYLSANTQVLNVDGNCRMLELPLLLHYIFGKKAKHSWFAAAGVSSYFMSKEDYTYDYLYLSSGNVVAHQKTYKNQTRNWLSIMQLSLGYTSKFGRVGDLRIEPYYTLPLKGIGYGELPLSSLGLRLGITSKHF